VHLSYKQWVSHVIFYFHANINLDEKLTRERTTTRRSLTTGKTTIKRTASTTRIATATAATTTRENQINNIPS
jgi:hypothetical protein